MGRKNLVRPNGSIVSVDEESIDSLKKLGYREETTEEGGTRAAAAQDKSFYTSAGQKVITAAEGLGSGLTVGLLDLALGDESKNRARYNPGTRIASEVVGAIAPAILTGGASAEVSAAEIGGKVAIGLGEKALVKGGGGVAARALSSTPAGLVSRAGTAVSESIGGYKGAIAGAALEGGIGGTGAAITQARLNDDPVTMESLLAGGTIGALVGGGVGGLAHGLSKVKPAAVADSVEQIGAKSGDNILDEFYNSLPPEKIAKKLPEPDIVLPINKTENVVSQTEFVPLESFGSIKAGIREPVGNIARSVEVVDDKIAESTQLFGRLQTEVDNITSKVAKLPGVDVRNPYKSLQKAMKSRSADEIDAAISDYISAFENQVGNKLNPKNVESIAEPLGKYKEVASKIKELTSLKEAANVLKEFPDKLEDFRKLRAAKAERMFAAFDTFDKVPEMAHIHSYIDKTLEDMGLSMSGSTGTKARAIWESTKSPGFFKSQDKLVKNTSFDLKGMPSYLDTPPAVKVSDKGDINKLRVPGSLDLTGAIQISEKDLDYIIKSAPRTATGKISSASKFLKNAAKRSAARFGGQAARKAGLGIVGSALAYETGGSATDMLLGGLIGSTVSGVRLDIVGKITAAARRAAPKLGNTLGKAAPRFGQLGLRIDGELDREDPKARIEEINTLAPSIRDKAFSAMSDLANDHPEFVKSFIDHSEKTIAAVQSFLPKDPGLAFDKGKSLWEPDAVEKVQIAKAVSVLHDPVGAAEYLASGVQDMVTLNMFKVIHPALYSHFQAEVALRIPSMLESMSYEEQSYYSYLTGIPLHSSFTSRSMAQTQAIYSAQSQADRERKNTGSKNNNGGRPPKVEPPTSGQSLLS